MAKRIVPVGIVGYGTAGSVFHAPLIRACERMEIAGILTSRDVPNRVGSLSQLIEQSELIVVASPNDTHFEIAKHALEAGRHVVIDKPFTTTIGEADELISLAALQHCMLSVFHNRRWDADFLTVRDLLPRLGEVMLAEANWDRFRPAIKKGWREVPTFGSGLFYDLGPHLLDQAIELFDMPDAIEGDIIAQRDAALVDDYFAVTLHYGRARVVLRSSTLVTAPRPRFAIYGTEGSFVKYGLDPQETQLKEGLDPQDRSFGVDPLEGVITDAQGSGQSVPNKRGNYLAFYEAVAAAILDGSQVPVAPQDARNGLHLIHLARRASEEGLRLPVPESSPTGGGPVPR